MLAALAQGQLALLRAQLVKHSFLVLTRLLQFREAPTDYLPLSAKSQGCIPQKWK